MNNDFLKEEIEPELLEEEDPSIYLSIGDLMSGLLMFFALLFITTLLQLAEKDAPKRLVIGNVVGQMKSNNINVKVNQETGDVSIQESILFAQGSTEIKPAGQAFLRHFIPIYSGVIFSKPEFDQEITRVVIEGHTSSEGDDKTNLQLSLLRSSAVYNYIFDKMNFYTKTQFSRKILAAGRGEIDADHEKNNPSDRTEVCIFDFGDWLVVEFFRGRGSEIRLLPNNDRNQQILFGDSLLSVKKIRCLGGYRHDHVYLWQVFCPQWLKHTGITTNLNTKFTRQPTPEKLLIREKDLQNWNRQIARLEEEAKDYCNKIGFCII